MSSTWKIRSGLSSVEWPGLPAASAATALALQYQLERTQWWPPAELERHQFLQVRAVLDYAYDTLRFWRKRLAAAGYSPRNMLTRESFRALPLLTRADIQSLGDALLSRAIPPAHGTATAGRTSGSTGRPIVYYGTEATHLFWEAFTLREHAWHERNLAGKLAAIRTGVEKRAYASWGPPTDLAFETGPSAGLNISTTIDEQLEWLQTEDPDYLITYPSNLRALALRALARGVRLPRLCEARTYGEMLPADLRELCHRAWNVPLKDMYSAMEAGYIAVQCPRHEHYHVQSENVVVEILDAANRPCEPGQTGRVVLTTLHNFAMPLIRYDIGDYAEAGEPCDCGRGLPVLKRIVGRVRNMVTLPDGQQHWASFPSSKWGPVAPQVTQLQLVQKRPDFVVVRVAVQRLLQEEECENLIAVLRECLGYPFRMQVEQVPEIARAPSGKFEEFVSEMA